MNSIEINLDEMSIETLKHLSRDVKDLDVKEKISLIFQKSKVMNLVHNFF